MVSMNTPADCEDPLAKAEKLCNEAANAVVSNVPGARLALLNAEMLRDIALARRVLNGGLETSARSVHR